MIYENVKRICKEQGISFHMLEIKAGIGNGVIAGWETNNNPKIQTLQKVAQALGVSVDQLTG